MGRYNIAVEIPDGKYCSGGLINPDVSCGYVGDSCASSAELCSLSVRGDCLLKYEDEENWRILKHSNCPSKLQPVGSRR